jgi:hypothetical protein
LSSCDNSMGWIWDGMSMSMGRDGMRMGRDEHGMEEHATGVMSVGWDEMGWDETGG